MTKKLTTPHLPDPPSSGAAGIGTCDPRSWLPRLQRAGPSTSLDEFSIRQSLSQLETKVNLGQVQHKYEGTLKKFIFLKPDRKAMKRSNLIPGSYLFQPSLVRTINGLFRKILNKKELSILWI